MTTVAFYSFALISSVLLGLGLHGDAILYFGFKSFEMTEGFSFAAGAFSAFMAVKIGIDDAVEKIKGKEKED